MRRHNTHVLSRDAVLRERARRVIPGGMYGHMNAARLPPGYPQFFARAEGCRLWDVDGNEYIDFMCSWGPIVLGHHHPAVEAAAAAQRARGDCLNGPGEAMVELAELLVELIPAARWALFAKNGTDATTLCVSIARAATGRAKILLCEGSYHGSAPWCTPNPAGTTEADRAHLLRFPFNDVAALERAVDAAGKDLAGILLPAFRHDLGRDQEMPSPAFLARARALCDAAGAALIVDEVRAGFRLALGGSWSGSGVAPDLAAWGKALANGYPLAAVTGNEALRQAATRVFATGSFWFSAVAMAAAVATLRSLVAEGGIARMARQGQRLRDGLAAQALRHGLGLRQTGPVQLPMVLFDDDPDCRKGRLWAAEAVRRGVYLHPQHNMFLSAAHDDAAIDAALLATDEAFDALRQASAAG